MRAILDTHAFLWWVLADERLPRRVRDLLEDEANDFLLSVASGWELAIKAQLGKIRLAEPAGRFIRDQLVLNAIEPIVIELEHALKVSSLPLHHRDPFDRMLVAQSQIEKLPIITNDSDIRRYDVETIW